MTVVEAAQPGPVAYCTLVTNDGYVTAALVLAKSVRDTGTQHPLVALITPGTMSESSQARLRSQFDALVPVDPLAGVSSENLEVIGRPDLHATMTKLHLWSLTQFSRVLYLDADTLVLQNLDHLFFSLPSSVTFAASPELGFPDCFNAGLMFLTPDEGTYSELLEFAGVHESFDGGDQGLLNVFFGDGTRRHPSKEVLLTANGVDKETAAVTKGLPNGRAEEAAADGAPRNWFRLSFTYNMEMHKVYRFYIPAVMRYRDEHKVLHFIGKDKPWHFEDGKIERPSDANTYFDFYTEMVGRWWDVMRSLKAA